MYIQEFIRSFCEENEISYGDVSGEKVVELSSLGCKLVSFQNYYNDLLNNTHLTYSSRLFFILAHYSTNQLAIVKVRNPSLRNYVYLGNVSSFNYVFGNLDTRLFDFVEHSLEGVWDENWITLSADLRCSNLALLPKLRNEQPDFQLLFLVSDAQVSDIQNLCAELSISEHYLLSMDKLGAQGEYLYVASTERLCLN